MNNSMLKYIVGIVIIAAISLSADAAKVGPITSFVNGTAAKASEVNSNFDKIKTAVDDNAEAIATRSPKLGYISVAAGTATVWQSISANFEAFGNYLYPSSGGTVAYASQTIQLPHGATVTALNCTVLDSTANGFVAVNLYRGTDTSTSDIIFTVASETSFTSTAHITLSSTTVENPGTEVIDNSLYSYFLAYSFLNSATFSTEPGKLKISSCNVEYTY